MSGSLKNVKKKRRCRNARPAWLTEEGGGGWGGSRGSYRCGAWSSEDVDGRVAKALRDRMVDGCGNIATDSTCPPSLANTR